MGKLIRTYIILVLIMCILLNPLSDVRAYSVVEEIPENTNEIPMTYMEKEVHRLCDKISNILHIDSEIIYELAVLRGLTDRAIYKEKFPDLSTNESILNISNRVPLEIRCAPWRKAEAYRERLYTEDCKNNIRNIGSAKNMADSLYTEAYELSVIMNKYRAMDRGIKSKYFDSLNNSYKERIVFYEAVLELNGDTIQNSTDMIEEILYLSSNGKYSSSFIYTTLSGVCLPNLSVREILNKYGVTSEKSILDITKLLSYDEILNKSISISDMQSEYVLPYTPNYASRENMMLAASCLVGKVRYVWGGGHRQTSNIDGINPIWREFNELYSIEKATISGSISLGTSESMGGARILTSELKAFEGGYVNECIKPSSTWCPVHGYCGNSVCSEGESVRSIYDYERTRDKILDASSLNKYQALFNSINYGSGIEPHRLEGLDCSGYVSWVYNQITDKYIIDSTADYFTKQPALNELNFGESLLPGDVFAWDEHIVLIVGRARDNSKAYVTLESTPDIVRYGVVYYSGASTGDILYAKQIAREANELLGGLSSKTEPPHAYCMNDYLRPVEGVTEGMGEIEADSIAEGMIESMADNTVDDTVDNMVSGSNTLLNYDGTDSSLNCNDSIGCDETLESEKTEKDEETGIDTKVYATLGRFSGEFNDTKDISSMTAKDIIQISIDNMPIEYITGYKTYKGELFNR